MGRSPWHVQNIDLAFLYEDNRCGICNLAILFGDPEDIDHIIPLCKGGLHVPSNLQRAHRRCNRRKGGRMVSGQNLAVAIY